jgi:hypothetical protein
MLWKIGRFVGFSVGFYCSFALVNIYSKIWYFPLFTSTSCYIFHPLRHMQTALLFFCLDVKQWPIYYFEPCLLKIVSSGGPLEVVELVSMKTRMFSCG